MAGLSGAWNSDIPGALGMIIATRDTPPPPEHQHVVGNQERMKTEVTAWHAHGWPHSLQGTLTALQY